MDKYDTLPPSMMDVPYTYIVLLVKHERMFDVYMHIYMYTDDIMTEAHGDMPSTLSPSPILVNECLVNV